uniref:PHD-type domain-containing protein n=1 Tax=Micromonas pusilla TaxID=38833 RepID=A0A7S0NHQ2_MICPS|mmetsp:Transcript_11334/g.47408  ORF Transcript_11334/g.47408 Transcript_11334/m.47408 type:complete len:898 (+) Transcript_11334:233-2926(+)
MGGGNAGLDPMGHGDDALYGKELRDALGSFPGGYVANGGDAGLAADHGKSNLANFQIRGVAQLDASADIYLDGNATDDAADSENDDNGPGVDAHMFDDLPVDTFQWSDVMRRRANGGPNGEFAFNPQPVNPNAAQHIFATRFSGGHGAATPSTEDLRITTVTPPPIDDEDDPPLAPHQPARTPSSREVLERVRARTPASTEPWAMSTAAAAAAVQKAIERQEIAIQARIRGVELAHEADEALDRAKEAAHLSAAIRRGETKPVPKNAVPASVMKRLAAERREREKKRKGSPEGSDALDSPASANGKLGSGKKGKQAKAAKAPPRPALDIKNDPRAAEVAKMWRKSAELDACAVCGEPDPDHWDPKDEIIFCDGCNLQVHLSCYGMRKVPEGEWMCVGCSDGLDVGKARLGQFGVCALCPQPGGALAKLDPPSAWDVAWESPGTHAHIACAECLPEVFIIRDKKNKPPLIDMSFVKGARMNLRCSLCDQEGACTQCAMKKCYASFHPLCARASGFAVERHVSDGRPMMFCKTHSGERWLEQRRVTAGKPAKDLLAKTEGATAQAAEVAEEAAVNAEVIEEDAVGVDKSKFLSLNGTVDAVKPEPEREESGDGYAAAAAATATRLWDGFAPFIADKRERSRFGKVARKLLADSGMDQKECGRLAALDASAGEAEASRAARGAERAVAAAPPPETPPTLAPGAPAEVAANAAAAQSMPWRVLRAHQRAGVDWLSARHLVGVGSIVCDRVGAGKRLTVLSHLMHLRDSMGVKGSHLLVCQPETIAAWTSELNRWCPRLRAVTLSCPADERNPAKAAILRAGADLIIVPTNVLVEAKAAEAKAAEAAEAAEAKAAEAPVETDEARAAARAAEDEEAAAAAAAAEASSSKKSKKKKKKKKQMG